MKKTNKMIGENSIIEDDVIIEKNVMIGRNVIVRKGSILKEGTILEDGVIVGYRTLTRIYDDTVSVEKTIIGKGVLIRPNSLIYAGCRIGDESVINHNVILREATVIGTKTSVGCLVKSEGYLSIGNDCSIHSLCSLTPYMKIEDKVFMGPGTISLNDTEIDYKREIISEKKGPWIQEGVRIGGNSTLCPGIVIGKYAFVAAGSLVHQHVEANCKVAGVPIRVIGKIKENVCVA